MIDVWIHNPKGSLVQRALICSSNEIQTLAVKFFPALCDQEEIIHLGRYRTVNAAVQELKDTSDLTVGTEITISDSLRGEKACEELID